ncbi:MAG TPA: signal peptidase II [Saprospiraceae bacterium]|nr:signal peptidase II [Saprospiraceae bacterium]HMQ82435.1 signal peptidase II [Saprospiraceae bacterium]
MEQLQINWKRIGWVLGIVFFSIALDQYTKVLARTHLQGTLPKDYLDGFFRLTYVENTGAFLSLGSDLPGILSVLLLKILPVGLLVGLLLYTLFHKEMNQWQYIAFSFISGGGISNIYDRLLYGEVTDFMMLSAFGLRTGIFNVADMSIMLGLFLMLGKGLFQAKDKAAPQADADNT